MKLFKVEKTVESIRIVGPDVDISFRAEMPLDEFADRYAALLDSVHDSARRSVMAETEFGRAVSNLSDMVRELVRNGLELMEKRRRDAAELQRQAALITSLESDLAKTTLELQRRWDLEAILEVTKGT